MNKIVASAEVLVLGASYREDVGDTRYSGSEVLVRKLAEMGAEIRVHDPYVEQWWEFKNQDILPTSQYSKKRFFRNQEALSDIEIKKDLFGSMKGVDCIVFAVRHKDYLELEPDKVFKAIGKPAAIIDCFAILDDEKIEKYFDLGCEVKGMGRGHIQRIKDKARKKKLI
jgi:UDP-N-acetyl-D-mannosaminuronate dehydrogenase